MAVLDGRMFAKTSWEEQSDKPTPFDVSRHYSRATNRRHTSNIKGFYRYFGIPGIGNLAGGLPNHHYFPFDSLEGLAALPDRFKPTPNRVDDQPSASSLPVLALDESPPSSRVQVSTTSNETDFLRRIDLRSALQYGTSQGYPPLYSFLRQFTVENLHPNIPYKGGPEIIVTCGNTDGFAKTLEALTDIWDETKDPIEERGGMLVEEFAYMNAIQAASPRGMNIIIVAIDEEGMKADGPGGLQEVLEQWDSSKGKRPHLLYIVSIGQNPTSGVLSVERRKAIYQMCCEFDIILIEDDPYWYLQYPSANSANGKAPLPVNYNKPKSSGFDFLDSLIPSFLSIDTEGRVVRLDTFSKTIAPGCRLGWITAQPALCERLLRITETSTQNPSGFVQSMVAELIIGSQLHQNNRSGDNSTGWKVDGWVRWLEGLRGNYERRMQTMCSILHEKQHLVNSFDKGDMYSFVWPLGGMFIWLQMHFENHPLWGKVAHEKLSDAFWAFLTTQKYLVLISPGWIFAPTERIKKEKGWKYFRICFAAVDDADVEPTSRRLVQGCQDFWTKKNAGDIHGLADHPDVKELLILAREEDRVT